MTERHYSEPAALRQALTDRLRQLVPATAWGAARRRQQTTGVRPTPAAIRAARPIPDAMNWPSGPAANQLGFLS